MYGYYEFWFELAIWFWYHLGVLELWFLYVLVWVQHLIMSFVVYHICLSSLFSTIYYLNPVYILFLLFTIIDSSTMSSLSLPISVGSSLVHIIIATLVSWDWSSYWLFTRFFKLLFVCPPSYWIMVRFTVIFNMLGSLMRPS